MSATVAAVRIEQIAPHLWWWTAPHPDWRPESFQNGRGWERDVSCYALVEAEAFVLFDPLVPDGEEERFWEAVDRDVAHHGAPAVLLTIYWHARSAGAVLDRYDGASVWVHAPSREQFAERVRVTNEFADGDELPGGVEAIALHQGAEAAFWLARHRALVLGDSLLGYEDRVELSPPGWLGDGESQGESEAAVRRALERGPDRLLLTHGGPRAVSELQL